MDDLKAREAEMRQQAATINAGRKPKFGDRMRNPWAGEQNPIRDGFFVRERRVTGTFNHGTWYEMTDSKGKFWTSNGDTMMFVDHLEAPAITEQAPPLPPAAIVDASNQHVGWTADQLRERDAMWMAKIAALRSEQAPAGDIADAERRITEVEAERDAAILEAVTQAWYETGQDIRGGNIGEFIGKIRSLLRHAAQEAALSTPPAVPPELTPMLLMNAALCCEPGLDVPNEKRRAIAAKLLSASKALSAAPASSTEVPKEDWKPITAPGQIKVGDKLRFELSGETKTHTVRQVLHAGTEREEIIYHKGNNWYIITSMAIAGTGSQKNVRVLSAAPAAQQQPQANKACQQEMRKAGLPYPRTCPTCALGPCVSAAPQPQKEQP